MPKNVTKLTAVGVKTAKPGRYGDGHGLYLLVRPTGGRFWLFRYKVEGRMREMGLGPAAGDDAVSLAVARNKAADLIRLVRGKVDPLAQREADEAAAKAQAQAAAVQAITFRMAADLYIGANKAAWRNAKHRQQWQNTLDAYALPVFGDLPVGAVDTPHVMACLEPIWREKPETASRLRGRIETVLDYARARQWRSGENPARWRGHIEQMLPRRSKVAAVQHHAALPWREMPGFWAELAQQEGTAALALRFAILTAARTGEVIGATWAEIDLAERLWTVPGARMKAGRVHRQPLSDAALAVLAEAATLRRTDSLEAAIFPGRSGGPLSNMSMAMLLRRMNRESLTVHGFRSSFRDWAAEATSYAHEVAEMALAHTVGDKVEAAYRRGDLLEKRRSLMEDWAGHCVKIG